MGLDIYAGHLTRYYSRNWENMTQQLTKKSGERYVMLDGDGNEIKPMVNTDEIEQIRDTINLWADTLAAKFDPPLPTPLWNEKDECGYYSDNPGWEAYGALVMLHACRCLNRPLPEFVEIGWNAYDEPVVNETMSRKIVNSILAAGCWLPIPEKALIMTAMPTGDDATISTVPLLKQELEELNQQLWQADEETILSWRNEKYYVPIIEEHEEQKLVLGFIRRKKIIQKEKYRTEDLAQCAFSILYQAMKFATEQHVPILLDY